MGLGDVNDGLRRPQRWGCLTPVYIAHWGLPTLLSGNQLVFCFPEKSPPFPEKWLAFPEKNSFSALHGHNFMPINVSCGFFQLPCEAIGKSGTTFFGTPPRLDFALAVAVVI